MKNIEHMGFRVPALGLGTFPLQGEDCYRAVLWALEIGYRHIDTAQLYGNEADVGRAIADSSLPRDEIFLTTKCGVYDATPGAVNAELTDSLEKLQTDYVDLWMLHWPNQDTPLDETLAAMAVQRDAGLVRCRKLHRRPDARSCGDPWRDTVHQPVRESPLSTPANCGTSGA